MNLKRIILGNNNNKYWKFRENYINTENRILKLYYYIRVKRIESKNNAETGISWHDPSASFASPPYFPHGLNGIVISRKAKVGKSAIILHQVTIGTAMVSERIREELKGPVIGDNVYIGAGAKVIGNISIGNNVIIGANAVVIRNVPDNCMAIGIPAQLKPLNPKYMLK